MEGVWTVNTSTWRLEEVELVSSQRCYRLTRAFGYLFYPLLLSFTFSSSLALCNPMDRSPPGSSVHGISQARILQWVAIPFSRGSS